MGKAGRKPANNKMRSLKGDPNLDRYKEDQVEFETETRQPPPPKGLSKDAKEIWKTKVRQMQEAGIWEKPFDDTFGMYCQSVADMREAKEKLDEQGKVLISHKGGQYMNPWFSTYQACVNNVLKLAARFGLTPSDQAGISAKKGSKEKKDDDLIK